LRAFHEIYNPVLAPQVLALLSSRHPGACLTMVGPDKGDGSLQRTRKLAADISVLDRIEFPGQVDKGAVPGWLDRGDIFLNTANMDNTPVSVIEAMACGMCVVSTDVGGMPYLLEDGRDGLLVPPGDAEAMAAAVNRILLEPRLAERLSANARRKVEASDWSAVLPMWDKLLTSLLSI
jgi:glycosyltransferase involved in cell wall biosynthesis